MNVLVIGCGISGITIGISLSKKGYNVSIMDLIEKKRKYRPGESSPDKIFPLLQTLGYKPSFFKDFAQDIEKKVFWGQNFNSSGKIIAIDRKTLELRLQMQAKHQRNIEIIEVNRTQSINRINNNWRVNFISNKKKLGFFSNFLIDATGGSSWLARKLGHKKIYFDDSVAIMGRFRPIRPLTKLNFILESAPNGWYYLAPQIDNSIVVAYLTDTDLLDNKPNKIYLLKQLNKSRHVSTSLKNYYLSDFLGVYDNRTSKMSNSVGNNWIAVGDASMKGDCLSGQGIYKSIESSLIASSLIESHFLVGQTKAHEFKYQKWIDSQMTAFLNEKEKYYSLEQRWKNNLFWKRRIKVNSSY